MKTPSYPTEQYHLDNHMKQEVTVVVDFEKPTLSFNAILLDDTARGIFVQLKSKEICFIPNTSYKSLILKNYKLPELVVNKETDEKK